MVENQIVEVGIDQDGKLYVRPEEQTFSYIYRAAMGVGWDPLRRALFAPKARECRFRSIADSHSDASRTAFR
jgi:hypothetical protein